MGAGAHRAWAAHGNHCPCFIGESHQCSIHSRTYCSASWAMWSHGVNYCSWGTVISHVLLYCTATVALHTVDWYANGNTLGTFKSCRNTASTAAGVCSAGQWREQMTRDDKILLVQAGERKGLRAFRSCRGDCNRLSRHWPGVDGRVPPFCRSLRKGSWRGVKRSCSTKPSQEDKCEGFFHFLLVASTREGWSSACRKLQKGLYAVLRDGAHLCTACNKRTLICTKAACHSCFLCNQTQPER